MAVSKILKKDANTGVSIPEGSHIGLFKGLVHVGTQENEFKGVKSLADQVLLQFELQDVLLGDGKPVTVSKIVRNSMHEKANLLQIGKALGADTTHGIDFESLVGKPVMVNMEPNEAKTKVVVKSFSPLPTLLRKEVKPLIQTPQLLFDVETISDAQVKELPEWVQKIINNRVKNTSVYNSDDLLSE